MPTINNLNMIFVRDKSGKFVPVPAIVGPPGKSPEISVQELGEEDGNGYAIIIKNADETVENVYVRNGEDGSSPEISMEYFSDAEGSGVEITIINADGSTETKRVYDGKNTSGGGAVSGDYVPLHNHEPNKVMATDENGDFVLEDMPDADPKGTADSKVAAHNTSEVSHNDIRLLISGLSERLNALADTDDTTLDQLSEIIAYIKSNKSLIDNITINKVNVTDIIDNLTTNVSNKPLSAKMGVELKKLIDAIKIPASLPASDVPSWAKQPQKPTYTAAEVGAPTTEQFKALSDQVDGKQPKGDYVLRNEIPDTTVQSVNGKTGEVKLNSADVGALPAETKIPTKTSDLTNDSGFVTKLVSDLANYYAKSQTYTRDEINELISAIPKFSISVVSSLPSVGISETTVYLVKSGSGDDIFTEYIFVDGDWEILGSQRVDLTGYAKETWVNTKLSDYLKGSDLQGAINTALAQAKASGEFDGASPEITLTEVNLPDSGVEIAVKNADGSVSYAYVYNGKDGKTPVKGEDYFTESDKQEIAQKAADMVDVPAVPVQSVNGKTGAVDLTAEDVGAATGEQFEQLSAAIVEQQADIDNQQTAIADIKASIGQQHLMFAEGDTVDEQLEWLESNGDTSKVYVLKDNFFYEHKKVIVDSGGSAYENKLPLATDTDRKTIYNGTGYSNGGTRLSSSGSVSSATLETMRASGFVSATVGDVIRIKNFYAPTGVSAYMISYNSANGKVAYKSWGVAESYEGWIKTLDTVQHGDWYSIDVNSEVVTINLTEANFGTGFNAIRFSGVITDETIVTVNEEIKEGGQTAIVETWASTGQALVPTDYDAPISELVNRTDAQAKAIDELKERVENGMPENVDALNLIRNWDAPIYDANIPVFALETEKAAKTNTTETPDAIYAMYDALMAKHPRYVKKTDLGVCSDGVNHIYRYDFREPEPYHQSNMPWSETKTKAILVSGIHYEWAGIYSLYYALEEIAENPKLYDLRRNTHFIVLPVLNPYCTITANYDVSQGVLNANGVQIHRNFEVGFIYPGESGYVELGGRNHGGTEPLSEMETQCLDNIYKENTDAAFFLTCHNFDSPSETNGLGFIWSSTATKYMCNMGYRLADKMTKSWLDRYSAELEAGIADYRTDNVTDDFIRFGYAHVSLTDGTETRQATKYGIQGTNVEVCGRFYPHGTKANVEPSLSEFTLSRGAETYINFLLTACGTYDYKDKALYTVKS